MGMLFSEPSITIIDASQNPISSEEIKDMEDHAKINQIFTIDCFFIFYANSLFVYIETRTHQHAKTFSTNG